MPSSRSRRVIPLSISCRSSSLSSRRVIWLSSISLTIIPSIIPTLIIPLRMMITTPTRTIRTPSSTATTSSSGRVAGLCAEGRLVGFVGSGVAGSFSVASVVGIVVALVVVAALVVALVVAVVVTLVVVTVTVALVVVLVVGGGCFVVNVRGEKVSENCFCTKWAKST